jgi:hypothetical protein
MVLNARSEGIAVDKPTDLKKMSWKVINIVEHHTAGNLPGFPLPVVNTDQRSIFVRQSDNTGSRTISTTVIQFTALISLADIDLREIANTSNLHIVRRAHKVHTTECTIRDDASARPDLVQKAMVSRSTSPMALSGLAK